LEPLETKDMQTINDTARGAQQTRSLPEEGFVRISAILGPGGPIPISKSTWWAGVKTGRFPAPVRLGRGITVWRVQDIRALIERTR
jgi:prophage regulatory protein